MSHLLKMLRSREWKRWSRRKKIIAIGVLALIVVAIGLMPDMAAVFARLLDVSMLDLLITFLGLQLIIYSDRIMAFANLAYGYAARRIRSLARARQTTLVNEL